MLLLRKQLHHSILLIVHSVIVSELITIAETVLHLNKDLKAAIEALVKVNDSVRSHVVNYLLYPRKLIIFHNIH